MSNQAKTQEEANVICETLKKEELTMFCPLTSDSKCNVNCVCFQGAYVNVQTYNKEYPFRVYPPCCNNSMFYNSCQYGS